MSSRGPNERSKEVPLIDSSAMEMGASPVVSGPQKPGDLFSNEEPPIASEGRHWGLIAVLTLMFGATILVWSLVQVSDRERAERILVEGLALLAEIDLMLDEEYEELVADAKVSRAAMEIPHYPLTVTIPAEELAGFSQEDLRERVLTESAKQVYEGGIGVFRQEQGGDSDLFSERGMAMLTIGQLTESNHRLVKIVIGVLLAMLIPLVLAVGLLSRGSKQLGNVGLALLLAAAPLAVVALGLHLGLRFAAEGTNDPFNAALLQIGAKVSWIPLWNFTIFVLLGLLFVVLARRQRPRRRR